MTRRRLVCTEDGSNKFWEGSVEGGTLTVAFGKVGTKGQAKDKDCGSPEAARKELEKLVKQKLAKGYADEAPTAGEAPKDEPAPEPAAKAKPAPKKPKGKKAAPALRWGFLDASGQWVIAPRFEDAGRFSGGLAAVKEGGLWGYCDPSGNIVIPPRFTAASRFQHGYARVELAGKRVLIDRSGEGRLLPMGEEITGSSRSLFAPFSDGLTMCRTDAGLGYMDESGEIVIEPRFDRAESFSGGRARVMPAGGWLWGYIDARGKIIVEPSLAMAGPFSEDLALVRREQDGPAEFIDPAGATVIPPSPHYVGPFKEGLARIVVDGKWGFIDRTGRIVIEPLHEGAESFSEGRARVRRGPTYQAEWGYIDTEGKMVIDYRFNSADDFVDGVALVRHRAGTDAVFLDRDGKPLHDGKFTNADGFTDGFARVGVAEGWPPGPVRWGLLARDGSWAIKPELEALYRGSPGAAPARVGGKWGLVDGRGAFIVAAEYDYIGAPTEWLIAVNRGGAERQGAFVGGLWGFFDRQGRTVVAPKFLGVRESAEGLTAAAVGEDD